MHCEFCKMEIKTGIPVVRDVEIMQDRFGAICFDCFFKRLLFSSKKVREEYKDRETKKSIYSDFEITYP